MPSSEPVLVLLHGWGMHAGLFDGLRAALADDFDVRACTLPGHGGRALLADNSLAAWADDFASQLPDGATVLGWSLGGQVALRAALDHPHKIARLALLASTPRFVAAPDWPHAMAADDLDAFAGALARDVRATLLRFLSLQTRGVAGQKALLHALRQTLDAAPVPSQDALDAGLAILRDTDLRGALRRLRQPALILSGTLDTLTPAAAGAWMAAQLPGARHVELAHAGHAPQLSHPQAVAAAVRDFCHA